MVLCLVEVGMDVFVLGWNKVGFEEIVKGVEVKGGKVGFI